MNNATRKCPNIHKIAITLTLALVFFIALVTLTGFANNI